MAGGGEGGGGDQTPFESRRELSPRLQLVGRSRRGPEGSRRLVGVGVCTAYTTWRIRGFASLGLRLCRPVAAGDGWRERESERASEREKERGEGARERERERERVESQSGGEHAAEWRR